MRNDRQFQQHVSELLREPEVQAERAVQRIASMRSVVVELKAGLSP